MPAFLPTLRGSLHLEETPAERVCWLWLLALAPPKPGAAGSAAAAGTAAAGELTAEATVQLQALLHDERAEGLQGVLSLTQLLQEARHTLRISPGPVGMAPGGVNGSAAGGAGGAALLQELQAP